MDFESCQQKQALIVQQFADCKSAEERYNQIIALGRAQPPLAAHHKIPANLVKGCQSILYLHCELHEGKVYFTAESDALISNGLAALLITVYSGESPLTILKCEPVYLHILDLTHALSLNRVSGLHAIYLRMKQEALKYLLEPSSKTA